MIQIEPARKADIKFVKEIEIESGLSSWAEADYLNELSRTDSIFFIAKDNSKIVGFTAARLITITNKSSELESEIEIYNIAVINEYRSKSIGTTLLDKIIETGKEKENLKIHLEVRKSRLGVQNFYKKNFFAIIGERRNFYTNPSEDAILMCRILIFV